MLRNCKIIVCVIACILFIWLICEQEQLYKAIAYQKFYSRITNVGNHPLLNGTNLFANNELTVAYSSLPQQQPNRSFAIKRLLNKETPFFKAGNHRVYLYSAVGLNIMNKTSNYKQNKHFDYSTIVLPGWEHKSIVVEEYICCYMLTNGSVISKMSNETWHGRHYLQGAKLQAKQYTCPAIIDKKNIKGISLYINLIGQNCSHSSEDYLTPSFPSQHNTTAIALCSKLAYGNLTASRLVEWFEAHKLFGVNKVLAYLHTNLNDEARRVFNYYVSTGMAEVLEFDLPEKEIVKRDVGKKNAQCWNDEQVVLFDCQIRLHGYKYVGVIDTDEFMVPVTNTFNNSWITYLDGVLHEKKNIAGISFSVQFHLTTWGPANNASTLFIGRYSNSTLNIHDRLKNIYMPSRVQIGSVDTHLLIPAKGFIKYTAKKGEAVLHHYRTCRKEWFRDDHNITENVNRTSYMTKLYTFKFELKCYDFTRHSSGTMQSIANILEPIVVKLCQQLGIQMEP